MIWNRIATWILKYRLTVIIVATLLTAVMGYFALKAKMRYDLTSAIPTNNPAYILHENFKQKFGEDGTMLVIGFDKKNIFEEPFFSHFRDWTDSLKNIDGVVSILGIPTAITIEKNQKDSIGSLLTVPVFHRDSDFNTSVQKFLSLPFYKNLLYTHTSESVLTAVYLDAQLIKTAERVRLINAIESVTEKFAQQYKITTHYSGLPYIRTQFAENVRYEMKLILIASLILTAIILYIFFRSLSTVFFSVIVVFSGVIWAVGIIYLCDFRISILTALIAPLVVVIGIPNCIYFLNKYHTLYTQVGDKRVALIGMVERMGIVTLFTNLTAGIGFGVFYFTQSQVLKEFGLVAGVSIGILFFISLFTLPAIFSYLPPPKEKHTHYLENKYLTGLLLKFEKWVIHHRKLVFVISVILLAISGWGISQLHSVGHIVDDLPKEHKLYKDLKYFEKNFHGVMPLEIVIDTRKKNGISTLGNIQKIDRLCTELKELPMLSKPLSFVEAIKFARQAYYDGDSNSFAVPNSFDIAFLLPYLKMKPNAHSPSQMSQLIQSFVDSNKQIARISVGIEDIGSVQLPLLLDSIRNIASGIFDSSRYDINYTGTSIVFLEGSKFIIYSLRDSLLLALIMIVICMIFLFRTWQTVIAAIIVNLIPLAITAGVMGIFNIPLKPSTVLVFSIALGIAIDVTIRFLVNYKQDLPLNNYDVNKTVQQTIQETGISIIYTSLILTAGFVVFLLSKFDGTKALGYLTALTLFLSMITNLTILPALLVWFGKLKSAKNDTA